MHLYKVCHQTCTQAGCTHTHAAVSVGMVGMSGNIIYLHTHTVYITHIHKHTLIHVHTCTNLALVATSNTVHVHVCGVP